MEHASSSTAQQSAEGFILKSLSGKLAVSLKPEKLKLSSGNVVQIDGANIEEKVVCEIYARIGKLRGSQPDKVASDFLKMLLVEKSFGCTWQKHFCFASEEAAATVKGNSWLSLAAKEMGIQVHVIEIPEGVANAVKTAQDRQVMVNKRG